jgi:hypothetical protein
MGPSYLVIDLIMVTTIQTVRIAAFMIVSSHKWALLARMFPLKD